ncbi:Killer toxin, Kp4 [Metarhizium guizhouense ARSEF 977]|uniref:Killer toxin, Kp4 n=1 Tax=Metarhizium guizhouense (strain ARSEF 977) TaxID=1276136 RepID=A0A0B4GC57_METGA|nr:Killer toxin, Kp4 [Metarhizium guizhouense ARSEF 977]
MLAVYLGFICTASAAINCRGSSACASDPGASVETIQAQVHTLVAQGGGDGIFEAQRPIACSQGKDGSFCAFFQNTSGTGKQAEALVQKLLDRGCKRCGSVATHPGNDVSAGALTVNFVKEPCCKGDCFCSGRGARIRKVE